jgi:ribosome maturation factor RimP
MVETAPSQSSSPRSASAAIGGAGAESPALTPVRALIGPIVEQLELDLYDLEHRGGILRVTIDTPPGSPGGVDLETIALATRLISRELDHSDPLPGRYTLEVTSPGVERSLRTPDHFKREVGKTLAIRLSDVTSDQRRVTGVLVAADDEAATIDVVDDPDGGARAPGAAQRRIEYRQIDRARTVFEWGPAPKPGRGPKKNRASKGSASTSAEAARAPGRAPTSPEAESTRENQEES